MNSGVEFLERMIKTAFQIFKRNHPKDRGKLISDIVKEHWPKSPWSNITPEVTDTLRADAGAGIACYAKHPVLGEIVLILVQAPNREGLPEQYQIPGGFMDFAKQEQPRGTALREMQEELIGPDGPILPAITPDRLVPLETAKLIYINDRPRFVHGFGLELTDAEFRLVQEHAARMADEAYKAKIIERSEGEVHGIKIIPLAEVLSRRSEILRHADQLSLFQKLQEHVVQSKPNPPARGLALEA